MADDLEENLSPEDSSQEKRHENEGRKPLIGKQFDSEYQPSGEAKSRGWKKRMALRDMLKLSTDAIKNRKGEPFRDIIALALDMNPEDVTLEMIMDFRQIEKASKRNDSYAYKVVKEFAHGKARQTEPDAPPPPADIPDDVQKSVIDLGDGMKFEL